MRWVGALPLLIFLGCKSSSPPPGFLAVGGPGDPPPEWLSEPPVEQDKVCSWGMAGRAYSKESEAPKELAKERAIENLAGVFHTTIQEAQIVRGTQDHDIIEDVEVVVEVPEDIVEKTQQSAETTYWRDDGATGPLGRESRGFTYARSCVDVPVKELDGKRVSALQTPPFSAKVPEWIRWVGSRAGGRLCAVGYSDPFYDPAGIFQAVVKDIRAQLKTQASTMIMNNFKATSTCRGSRCTQIVDDMIQAATDAISEGVVVTHFWYDQHGKGLRRRKRTAYGWGCVYPVNVMAVATKVVKKKHPEIKIADVKKAADKMFDELEAMEDKMQPPKSAVENPVMEAMNDRPPEPKVTPPEAPEAPEPEAPEAPEAVEEPESEAAPEPEEEPEAVGDRDLDRDPVAHRPFAPPPPVFCHPRSGSRNRSRSRAPARQRIICLA